jgi:hypothetical protein
MFGVESTFLISLVGTLLWLGGLWLMSRSLRAGLSVQLASTVVFAVLNVMVGAYPGLVGAAVGAGLMLRTLRVHVDARSTTISSCARRHNQRQPGAQRAGSSGGRVGRQDRNSGRRDPSARGDRLARGRSAAARAVRRRRFTAELSDDRRTMRAAWEESSDGTSWEHDFDLTYTRVA